MKRLILSTIILLAAAIPVASERSESAKAAHAMMHQSQLANAKLGMDKSVISNLLQKEILARESKSGISAKSSLMIKDLLSEAKRHIGKPYSAGSKGPRAFDCSGFSSYVYRQFGISLSASSSAQYGQGEKVDRKDLSPGDLVFFTSRRSGSRVGHVGIVVSADNESGNFKFIHASNSSGITISDYKGYYVGRYIGARRIINE